MKYESSLFQEISAIINCC